MNASITPLHRGFVRQVPNAHIARALGDVDDVLREAVKADNLRDGVPLHERQADNLRRFYSANPRFAARHYRIGESKLDLFAGIAFWFLVGMAPALAILAIMVLAK